MAHDFSYATLATRLPQRRGSCDFSERILRKGVHYDLIRIGFLHPLRQMQKGLPFLAHYDMDLSEFATRPELKGECYLCDNCKRTCPKNISGRGIAMEHRKTSPSRALKFVCKKIPIFCAMFRKKHEESTLSRLQLPRAVSGNLQKAYWDLQGRRN